jgi:hypothetical protein
MITPVSPPLVTLRHNEQEIEDCKDRNHHDDRPDAAAHDAL